MKFGEGNKITKLYWQNDDLAHYFHPLAQLFLGFIRQQNAPSAHKIIALFSFKNKHLQKTQYTSCHFKSNRELFRNNK
ncbi:hypothetical protein [Klebsiella sp. BIGb0407]|uniref:hypothetical protein n=1 Tax=Klebsiella sp. BIGb0407 TaxID=2940603 RepID=UPI002168DD7A|nr:hypothetical protein [Klebsiella sp. BIGb0407]MCS3434120.1 hypothetical protein [Klebsiella sp. BIGb0407]